MASAQLQPHLHERWLREKTVRDVLMEGSRRRLVEVPYTASLTDTMNALVAHNVFAVPVAAPPGHWIGAGGSMILESDRTTAAIRKHYIGIVTMLDIISHIAEATDDDEDGNKSVRLDEHMAVPVSDIIGHSSEGLSLWTLNPSTSLLDCLEVFSKGIHRALVPLDSEHVAGVELTESSPGYQMLTQMDVARFIKQNGIELQDILTQSVGQLGAVNEYVFSAKRDTKLIEAIRFMRSTSVTAIPIIESSGRDPEANGKKLIGTFSATDLRACPIALLQSSLNMGVIEFLEKIAVQRGTGQGPAAYVGYSSPSRMLISCYRDTSLAEVMNQTVNWHVHRVWVVDDASGSLDGLVSLTDIFGALRASVLGTVA